MKLNGKSGIRGFYKIETFKGNVCPAGNIIEEPGSRKVRAEFENLITDSGLNAIGSTGISTARNFFYVGTGSTPPSVSDSNMDNFVAATSSNEETNQTSQTSSPPYYLSFLQKKRFGQGDAAGNLAEVGAGSSGSPSGNLFSRALIQDSGGNPTTITVLSDEFLDVTYELRIYPDTDDAVGTVMIGGVTYDYTARPSQIDLFGSSGWNGNQSSSTANASTAYSGSIGDVFSNPSGSQAAAVGTNGIYSNNSLEGSASFEWGLSSANFGGVRSVALSVGWTRWQIQFDAQGSGDPIPKDDTNVLNISMVHSWNRGSI